MVAAALLWQSGLVVNLGTPALPEHLRYERQLVLPAGASGFACATLDAEVLAHTASAAHNDLRLYRGYPESGYRGLGAQAETPYTLTESGPEPVADAEASVLNAEHSGDGLRFDLRMPSRAYADVILRVRARGFVGTAIVTGEDARGRRVALGSFGIFDLSDKKLGRWTVLPMAETTAPVLHVLLNLRTPEGRPIRGLPLALIEGAAVPPSRERQTLYTAVAASGSTVKQGNVTAAIFHVPAHVPVERIRFVLPPGYGQGLGENYDREVIVRARADRDPAAETEVMDAGAIQHVSWPSGDPRLNPIDVTTNTVDATIGATLASAATVRVLVANGTEPPLPMESVVLEMRERKVCFRADAGARYTLRYGDPALAAPIYDEPPTLEPGRETVAAALGPPRRNPQWRPREDRRSYLDRHPEVFWLVVLACAGMMGGTALHYVQHRGGGGQV